MGRWVVRILIALLLVTGVALALDDPEQKVTRTILDFITARDPNLAGGGIRVNYLYAKNIFDSLRKLDGRVELAVADVQSDFRPMGNVIFPIAVTADGASKKVYIRTKIEVFKKIVYAKRLIRRGEQIKDEDVALEDRDIALLPNKYFSGAGQVVGKEAKLNIPAQSTLFEWMIKEVPLVHRGEEVAVRVIGENLLVKARAIALEDGYKNANIKVKIKDSKKTMDGVLISKEEVEVKLK